MWQPGWYKRAAVAVLALILWIGFIVLLVDAWPAEASLWEGINILGSMAIGGGGTLWAMFGEAFA